MSRVRDIPQTGHWHSDPHVPQHKRKCANVMLHTMTPAPADRELNPVIKVKDQMGYVSSCTYPHSHFSRLLHVFGVSFRVCLRLTRRLL